MCRLLTNRPFNRLLFSAYLRKSYEVILVKQDNKKAVIGWVITVLGAIFFSTKAIIVKKAFADTATTPLLLLSLRMLFSLPFYIGAALLVSRRADNKKLTRSQWFWILATGATGYYISSLFDFLGLQYISAGLERLILFLYPSFAVVLNQWLFRIKMRPLQKLALLLTYAGVFIAYLGELHIDTSNPDFFKGSLLVFTCAVTYSFYLVGSGRLVPKVGAVKFTAYAMLAATVGVLLHGLFSGAYHNVNLDRTFIGYSVLLALIATVIPSFMLSYGMKSIGANNAAIVSSIGPVSTILQAHWILGEPIFAAQVGGTLLVIVGVVLIGWQQAEKKTT
ncbi:DMT family transporter [Taibaiella soli]|uniref:EamA/RhaT family transporter n=1 Tax=Taibaiella soli TaxID=1649169 RepID=A0A2W2B187_9BACT|nr:DMT family transporter [Taibaiella soli]PZF74004.1 EamA/RhaT family transporter [Taibaiella soli]